jgi:CMP-N-acetylneuraminic acid synthetase/spore coat polysaccharide biosynthesis predicted glycosyltransferase SpsG
MSWMSPSRGAEPQPSRGARGDRRLLAIVPARGGSRDVPNKNLRSLGGRPLIAHTVEAVRASGVADRLLVSSDSDAVLRWAELQQVEARPRPARLACDQATISEVAAHIADELDWNGDVGVFQPTSPFRQAESIVCAVARFHAAGVDSLASCVREPHLYWLDADRSLEHAVPLFEERVNRQDGDHRVLKETGSIQLVRAAVLRAGREMVTQRHLLFETSPEESLDIDTTEDLVVARRRFEQGTVIFRLRANSRVGAGHIYHCLELADELADQRLRFLLRDCDPFVEALVSEHGYSFLTETDLATDLAVLAGPGRNLVLNDVLDTTEREVLVERSAGFSVVNIEDLGPGARLADWVVNALYPIENGNGHGNGVSAAGGAAYATLRSEFHDLPEKEIRPRAERVLITFGGTDPHRLAARCARVLDGRIDAELRVVIGPGASSEGFPENIEVKRHVRSMAAEMMAADLVLTSAGRTVYEVAAAGTPVAVLAQSARDATHAHLSFSSGVIFLGVGPLVDDEHVVGVVRRLLDDYELRVELSERLRASVDSRGAARIGHAVRAMLRSL